MHLEQTIGIHDIIGKHDAKKSSILKNGIGIEGQKSMQTSKKHGSK